ncbi:unnamed protein product [Adineta steineri]|uniref:Uncharacterized protein n=1 Tax=Adineta steineri TaxID=433720 RepID=A0A820DKZ4_9BILA|nr:unnamed protein product [Adineta steineri]
MTQNSQSQNFCHLVMKCTNMKGQYPIEETCSELTFNFWHALKEEITSTNEDKNQAILLEIFRPYFEHLIEVLISKGQIPENENVFTSEDKELFRSYRLNIIDTMVNITVRH